MRQQKLIPLEEAELEDADASLAARPRGGVVDQIAVKELRRIGFSDQKILNFLGWIPPSAGAGDSPPKHGDPDSKSIDKAA